MPEIFYAVSLRGREQAQWGGAVGFGESAGVNSLRAAGASYQDQTVPVPVGMTPVYDPRLLWHSETGWEPYRYPASKPSVPKTVSINMEFTIPADSTEAHIHYRD